MKWERIFFDPGDRELVKTVAAADRADSSWNIREYASELHPRGIIELVEPRALRIVRSVMTLLDNFTPGTNAMEKRLNAMTMLRDELCEGLSVPLKFNTARVLLELAKELIRLRRTPRRSLRAAHDLRMALLGNPRFIRSQLKRFQLLEMPEDSTPVTFDYHVHDANTKGRKSPSHLIMDAWIKGIRKLQVIHYNQVPPEGAFELMRAAEIMGIDVRIGIEFRVLHRGHFAELIWTPRGFSGADDFLKFLSKEKNSSFKARCEEASLYHTSLIFGMIRRFNVSGLKELNKFYGVEMAPVSDREFSAFLVPGRRPASAHAAEFIEQRLRTLLKDEQKKLLRDRADRDEKRLKKINRELEKLHSGIIREKFLDFSMLEEVPGDIKQLPAIMRLSPAELTNELRKYSKGFRLTLNLTRLTLADVIEILYDCRGEITTLEIFNLKDHLRGLDTLDGVFNDLRHALNSGNVVTLKSIVLRAIDEMKSSDLPYRQDAVEKLRLILRKLPKFASFYSRTPLKSAIGSDSAGKAAVPGAAAGMGFAVIDTLPGNVRRALSREKYTSLLPVRCDVFKRVSLRTSKWLPGKTRHSEWAAANLAESIGAGGNLVALGYRPAPSRQRRKHWWNKLEEHFHYLNSNIKIILKVLTGFTAAFLTFYFSGSWWVLAWFGAPIWLGITLSRNVIQFRIAAGAFRASPLLKWQEFISWQRISDSLFFTGLSVPLLDLVVKNLIMRQTFGITTENNPMLLYCTMGLANGLYITAHNLLRALPAQAILGNWLRVPLAIPIAFSINAVLAGLLHSCGVHGAETLLQQWAAVISKFSSDCVGGAVEAIADRGVYIRNRLGDLKRKQADLFRLVADLELAAPEQELTGLLDSNTIFNDAEVKKSGLINRICINSLDFMYFWMRQPRAPQIISRALKAATPEERQVFTAFQMLLLREKTVKKLLAGNALGGDCSRALNFYLRARQLYLDEISEIQKHTS